MRIRTTLLAAPLVVVLMFLAAFVAARPYFNHRIDQLTIMDGIEPEMLNPILSTTLPAYVVESFLFDGLTDMDENLDVKPSLAERFDLTQRTHLYFPSPAAAQSAAGKIREHRTEWPAVKLREVTVDADAVVLGLDAAGTVYQDTVFAWIGPADTVKVQRWNGGFARGLTWQDRPVTADTLIDWVSRTGTLPPVRPRILYVWKNISTSYEIFTVGADGTFMDDLQRRFAEYIGAKVEPAAPPAGAPADAAASAPANAPAGAGAAPPPDESMRLTLAGPLRIRFDTSWSAQDEPVIAFHLRQDVKWHDQAPLTAADVKFTYDALMSEQNVSPRRSDFEIIRDVRTPDDYTVIVTYKEPYSPCLYSWGMPIIPKHLLGSQPNLRKDQTGFNRMPTGTGPFRITDWRTDQYIQLERYDRYWEGRPHLPRITFRIIPDTTVSQLEFQTRGFDYTGLQPYQVGRFAKDPRYDVFRYPVNEYSYIGWNLKRPVFHDKRVRHALAHAVDNAAIIKYIIYGNGTPCTGPYTPVTRWWNPDVQPLEYDPARARRLLAEAGWTPGPDGILRKDGQRFHFTFVTATGSPLAQDVAVLAKDYLRQVGIDADINMYEWTVYIEKYIDTRNFDACIMSWSLGFDQDLYQLWHSSQIPQPRSLNFISYANPEVDRLIEKARTEFDLTKVEQYTRRIQELIYDDQPYLFMFYRISNVAIPKATYHVERPGEGAEKGTWINEPIRPTKQGIRIYQRWWAKGPARIAPVGGSVIPAVRGGQG